MGIGVHILGVVGVRQSPLCIREGTPALPKPKRPELASHSDHPHTADTLLLIPTMMFFFIIRVRLSLYRGDA